MDAAMYLRKSRADNESEDISITLNRHMATLLEFAKKNSLTILHIYQEVVSGDSLVGRPQMLTLLQDVELGKYEGVLCMDIDRLGRGTMRDMGIILETFKAAGTKIITPRKVYDLNDELDEFSTEIQSLIARQELKNITRRMQQGKKRSAAEGYHIAEPPFGYRREYINRHPTLRIEPSEAEVVNMVFDLYANQGIGTHLIAERLNKMGIKPRKSDKFSRNSVKWILTNPIYTGKILWNRKRRVKGRAAYVDNPVEEWIDVEGVHQAIIDDKTFERAQTIRGSRSHPPSNTGEIKNPLSGIMYCSRCGAALVRQYRRHKKYQVPRLLCPNVGCCRSSRLDDVEAFLIGSLAHTLEKYKREFAGMPEHTPKQNIYIPMKKRLLDELNSTVSQRNRLHDLLEQGVYDIETFTSRSRTLSERESAIKFEIANVEKQIAGAEKKDFRLALVPRLEKLLSEYWGLTAPSRNALLRSVINRVHYEKDASQWGNLFSLDIHLREDV